MIVTEVLRVLFVQNLIKSLSHIATRHENYLNFFHLPIARSAYSKASWQQKRRFLRITLPKELCVVHILFGEKNTLQPPPAMGAIFGSPDIGDKSKSKTRLQKFSNGKA